LLRIGLKVMVSGPMGFTNVSLQGSKELGFGGRRSARGVVVKAVWMEGVWGVVALHICLGRKVCRR
jgi:hypothetical protein